MSKEMQDGPLEAPKGKETFSPLESLKRIRALLTIDFSPMRPKSDFCSIGL